MNNARVEFFGLNLTVNNLRLQQDVRIVLASYGYFQFLVIYQKV